MAILKYPTAAFAHRGFRREKPLAPTWAPHVAKPKRRPSVFLQKRKPHPEKGPSGGAFHLYLPPVGPGDGLGHGEA